VNALVGALGWGSAAVHLFAVGTETRLSFDASDLGTVMGFLACENFWDFRENGV